jgi:hypothetical protein
MNIISELFKKYSKKKIIKLGGLGFEHLNEKNEYDIVTIEKPRIVGLKLNDDVLFVDIDKRCSFRSSLVNIGKVSNVMAFSSVKKIQTKEEFTNYFKFNQDNPYAVLHVIDSIRNQIDINHKTQFPPLSFYKNKMTQAKGIDNLKSMCEPGDIIFTFDRSKLLHWLIREIDVCHWAHCGVVGPGKTLLEMVGSGGQEVSLDTLKIDSLDVGLYRPSDPSAALMMAIRTQVIMNRKPKYNYKGVIKIYLKNIFGFKFKDQLPTSRHILMLQDLHLITFA